MKSKNERNKVDYIKRKSTNKGDTIVEDSKANNTTASRNERNKVDYIKRKSTNKGDTIVEDSKANNTTASKNERNKVDYIKRKSNKGGTFMENNKIEPNSIPNFDEDEHRDNVNYDARALKNAIDNRCFFHTCGICEWEGSLNEVVAISEIEENIKSSDLKLLYKAVIAKISNKYDIAYGKAMKAELNEFGIINDAEYVCKKCAACLKGIINKFILIIYKL